MLAVQDNTWHLELNAYRWFSDPEDLNFFFKLSLTEMYGWFSEGTEALEYYTEYHDLDSPVFKKTKFKVPVLGSEAIDIPEEEYAFLFYQTLRDMISRFYMGEGLFDLEKDGTISDDTWEEFMHDFDYDYYDYARDLMDDLEIIWRKNDMHFAIEKQINHKWTYVHYHMPAKKVW